MPVHPAPGPSSLPARSLAAVWHPCTQMQRAALVPPLPIARGEGPWLIDTEGRRYFDATSSWWVNLFGHADARLNAAIKDQLDTLAHVMLAGCTHAPAVELAERLSAKTGGVLGHAFFASDGASAVEIALKMSFHHWRNLGRGDKREFVCLRHGYHGETLGALAVTDVQVFRDAYDPLLMHAHTVMSPDARQALAGETPADVATRAAAELRALFEARHAHIAALIVEPLIQCAAGMAMHDASYLGLVRALCDEFDIHLIADEIAVGCGRTGSFFACEQAGVWPDFVCLSKGISGGYLPLSLVLTRDSIYAAFLDDDVARGFLHSHSYTGNPLACRAALAVLDRFDDDDVLAANRVRAAGLTRALAPLAADPRVLHVRQHGMVWAFDVREDLAGPALRRTLPPRRSRTRPADPPHRPHRLPDAALSARRRHVDVAGGAASARRWTPRCRAPPPMLLEHLNRRSREREAAALVRTRRIAETACAPLQTVSTPTGSSRELLAFCSNDYLGLANHPLLIEALAEGARRYGVGSGASHLVSGHSRAHADLEDDLAAWMAPCIPDARALFFGTGYLANLALTTALGDAGTTLFADKLNHASLVDGALLATSASGKATLQRYPHGRLDRLEAQLQGCTTPLKLIVTDAVFSMDGDIADLPALLALAERFDAWLVVDDAHGFGVLGQGVGTLAHFGLRSERLICMGTLGKAAGVGGAFVAAHPAIVDALVQSARPYIYTTAAPPAMAHALRASLRLIAGDEGAARRAHLGVLVDALRSRLGALIAARPGLGWALPMSSTAIQPLVVGDNAAALALAAALDARGLWVPAIRPPTVPVGSARLRITLSASHTLEQVDRLVAALTEAAG